MPQLGPSDYRTADPHRHAEGIMDQVRETAHDIGGRTTNLPGELAGAIREHPYTTLAIAAGLAFAVGAIWKLGRPRPQTRFETLLSQLPDLPNRERLVPRSWR
jgi:hypothetical protein